MPHKFLDDYRSQFYAPSGGEGGSIPTGFDIKLSLLGLEFDKFVLSHNR